MNFRYFGYFCDGKFSTFGVYIHSRNGKYPRDKYEGKNGQAASRVHRRIKFQIGFWNDHQVTTVPIVAVMTHLLLSRTRNLELGCIHSREASLVAMR